MLPTVEALYTNGVLVELDVHLARTLGRIAGDPDPLVQLAVAVTSRATTEGHVCVQLAELAGEMVRTGDGEVLEEFRWPMLNQWLSVLQISPLVGDGSGRTPLVLDGKGRLYLYRYWQYQQQLAQLILLRAGEEIESVDESALTRSLIQLFPKAEPTDPTDQQRLAAAVAVLRKLSVISGGPGTGKTTTVVKILMLLLEQAERVGIQPLRIALVAPTGKAAARLSESIRQTKLELAATKRNQPSLLTTEIPETAMTIHRCLGVRYDKPTTFRHNAQNPLPVDVLILDEASMVDLALMTKLVQALPNTARLILLGDKDQLASVESGAVLGDICDSTEIAFFSPRFAERLQRISQEAVPVRAIEGNRLKNSIVQLTRNYRFDRNSSIGQLATGINRGDQSAVARLLDQAAIRKPKADLQFIEMTDPRRLANALEPFISQHYLPYLHSDSASEKINHFSQSRILCAHRRGPDGVVQINRTVEAMLARRAAIRVDEPYYLGRPVMIIQNDYRIGLFNGDIGLVVVQRETAPQRHVVFVDADGTLRSYSPLRLPPLETVYAMTVHKSQGSQFNHVLIILPAFSSPLVTRELLYTAVTRARRSVTLLATKQAVLQAIQTPVHRRSGLRDQLWRS